MVFFMTSCNADLDSNPKLENDTPRLECSEAFPNQIKEVVKLASGVSVEKTQDGLFILGGDIILSPEQVKQLDSPITETKAASANIIPRWTNGIIFYKWANSNTANDNWRWRDAMTILESTTNIRFVERTNQVNYVELFVTPNTGNHAYLGMLGGRQPAVIDFWDNTKRAPLHELCHTIGLIHEQCRSDRDQYIDIIWDNIQPSKQPQFEIYNNGVGHILGQRYEDFDFGSIMLYTPFGSFAIDYNKPIMRMKDGKVWDGNTSGLSIDDRDLINTLYP